MIIIISFIMSMPVSDEIRNVFQSKGSVIVLKPHVGNQLTNIKIYNIHTHICIFVGICYTFV